MNIDARKFALTVIVSVNVLFWGAWILFRIVGLGVSETATISEVYVCKGQNELPEALFEKVGRIAGPMPSHPSLYFVCGYLTTDGRPARLRMLMRNEDAQLVQDTKSEYSPGFFHISIFNESVTRKGKYTVKIYLGRTLLAETTIPVDD